MEPGLSVSSKPIAGPSPPFAPISTRPGSALRPAVRVVRAEVFEFLSREDATHYDLALVDPPYSFDAWPSLLDLLQADLAVLETSAPVAPGGRFLVRREYRYGGTLVTLVEARGLSPHDPRTTEKDTV